MEKVSSNDDHICYSNKWLLITLCIIITIIDLIVAWTNVENEESNHMNDGIHLLISSVDQLLNFLCVMLSYSYFNTYYMKLFSCIHTRCHLIVRWVSVNVGY